MSDRRDRDERLQIMLSPTELAVIDDFRFKTSHAEQSSGCARTTEARTYG